MKKVVLSLAFVAALVSCKKADDAATADSTAAVADSATTEVVDTAATTVDTAATKVVDTAAAKVEGAVETAKEEMK